MLLIFCNVKKTEYCQRQRRSYYYLPLTETTNNLCLPYLAVMTNIKTVLYNRSDIKIFLLIVPSCVIIRKDWLDYHFIRFNQNAGSDMETAHCFKTSSGNSNIPIPWTAESTTDTSLQNQSTANHCWILVRCSVYWHRFWDAIQVSEMRRPRNGKKLDWAIFTALNLLFLMFQYYLNVPLLRMQEGNISKDTYWWFLENLWDQFLDFILFLLLLRWQ